MNQSIPVVYGEPIIDTSAVHSNKNVDNRQGVDLNSTQKLLSQCPHVTIPPRTFNSNLRQQDMELLPHQLEALLAQGYTPGLARALYHNQLAFAQHIWIVDNSGSMVRKDGHRLAETTQRNQVRLLACSRWEELQQTVLYHAQMAALLQQPTVFRLLNDPGWHVGPQQFGIAQKGCYSMGEDVDKELSTAMSTMQNVSPSGVTPLTHHIRDLYDNLLQLQPQLVRDDTKIALILATDGLPTNSDGMTTPYVKREFREALQALKIFPLWIVVRLCTNEPEVVDFWHDLGSQHEISLEVLGDFTLEALEVNKHNPWVNYGLQLHRMREMGSHDQLLDLFGKRQLSRDEVTHYCEIIFGQEVMRDAPDYRASWDKFTIFIQNHINNTISKHDEMYTWNPITKRMAPWIDIRKLQYTYGTGVVGLVRKCCKDLFGSGASRYKND